MNGCKYCHRCLSTAPARAGPVQCHCSSPQRSGFVRHRKGIDHAVLKNHGVSAAPGLSVAAGVAVIVGRGNRFGDCQAVQLGSLHLTLLQSDPDCLLASRQDTRAVFLHARKRVDSRNMGLFLSIFSIRSPRHQPAIVFPAWSSPRFHPG